MNTKNNASAMTTAEMVNVKESEIDNPVAYVRQFAAKNHKKLGRAGCVRALVAKGIAYYTARTQYQWIFAKGFRLPGKGSTKRRPAKVAKAPKAEATVAAAA